jgi:hypothetical protein
MTGFACAWQFRRDLHSPRDVLMKFVIPLLGGLLLLGVFVEACIQYAAPDYGYTVIFGIGGVFVIGIGTLVVGALLMVIYERLAPAFFRGETLHGETPEAVLQQTDDTP